MMLYDVLKASKGLYVDDSFAMLWGKQLGGWTVTTITGVLPMTFRSNGTALIGYRIYGTAEGAGVQTENLLPFTNGTKTSNNVSAICANGNYTITIGEGETVFTELTFDILPVTFPISVDAGGMGILSLFNTEKTGISICFKNSGTIVQRFELNFQNRVFDNYTDLGGATINQISFRIQANTVAGSLIVKPMLTDDSIELTTFSPYGYKLQMQTKQRTKNLLDITGYDRTHYGVLWYENNGQLKASGTYSDSAAHTWPRFYVELSAGTYTLSGSPNYEQSGVQALIGTCTDAQGSNFTILGYDTGSGYTFTLHADSWVSVRIYTAASLYQQTIDLTLPLMLRRADTSPDFEPYYNSKEANIYIGDSKLAAGDYVDYESGKIVRNGTPQDPPLPLPAIETFSGENTLDSTETLGEVTIKGRIKEAE